jgi:hypothetical protein
MEYPYRHFVIGCRSARDGYFETIRFGAPVGFGAGEMANVSHVFQPDARSSASNSRDATGLKAAETIKHPETS